MTLTRRQEIATLYLVGFSHAEIAAAMGIAIGTVGAAVSKARRTYGFRPRSHSWRDDEERYVVTLVAQGRTKRQIAGAMGLRYDQVKNVVYRCNRQARQAAPAAG